MIRIQICALIDISEPRVAPNYVTTVVTAWRWWLELKALGFNDDAVRASRNLDVPTCTSSKSLLCRDIPKYNHTQHATFIQTLHQRAVGKPRPCQSLQGLEAIQSIIRRHKEASTANRRKLKRWARSRKKPISKENQPKKSGRQPTCQGRTRQQTRREEVAVVGTDRHLLTLPKLPSPNTRRLRRVPPCPASQTSSCSR